MKSTEASFSGNVFAWEALARLCALFRTGGTLECWHKELWHGAVVAVNHSSVRAGRRGNLLTRTSEGLRRGQGAVGAGRWPSSRFAMHQTPPDAAAQIGALTPSPLCRKEAD